MGMWVATGVGTTRMVQQVFLAVDIGASSGRLVAGEFDGERIALTEVERFDNGGVAAGGYLH